MLISAFQKSTLLDYPGKLACLVFTYGCNLRCEYCHNPELVIQPFRKNMAVSEEEIFFFLKKRKSLIDGVVITGGEPTLQKDLIPFIKKIKNMGFLAKLDTNGTNSKVVKKILDLDIVDYWAMDVKYEKEIYIQNLKDKIGYDEIETVSYTHLRAHEAVLDLVCRLLLDNKKRSLITRSMSNNVAPT